MASGDSLITFTPLANRPPAADFASLDLRGDFVVLDFDDAANEASQFYGAVPSHYNGGDIVVTVTWTSTTAVTGTALLRVEAIRLAAGDNLDAPPAVSDSEDIAVVAPLVGGDLVVSQTAPLTVSELSAGDTLQIIVTRVGTDGSDTLVGDIELFAVEIGEV